MSGQAWVYGDAEQIQADLWKVLDAAPNEVAGLRQALLDGRVNGRVYLGACACLLGTIANLRGCSYLALEGLPPDSDRLAEQFFLSIHEGDTPTTNPVARQAVEWIDAWMAERAHA